MNVRARLLTQRHGTEIRVNEFYKKGCQGKSSASTGGEKILSRDPAHCCKCAPRFAREVLLWLVCDRCGVHVPMVTTPIESGKVGKRVLVSLVSTMVLSEARGLSLFLVIRGGIACNG